MLFPTTLVGSFPQPDWLIDSSKLHGRFPQAVRAKELWRIPLERLEEAWNDATLIAINAQEDAGLDIITDGEIRRESYSNGFATALAGIDSRHARCLPRNVAENKLRAMAQGAKLVRDELGSA